MRIAIITENKKVVNDLQLIILKNSIEKISIFLTVELALLYGEGYQTIDVVVIDLDFKKGFSWELIFKLRMINPQLIFIFLAKNGKEAAKAYEFSIDDFIVKPVTEERLEQALAKVYKKSNIQSLEKTREDSLAKKIKIVCLQKFEITVENQKIKWISRKAEELVAYLLEKREISVHKEKILKDLWPEYDYEKGLKALHMTVFRARQSLEQIKDYIKIHYALDYYRITVEGCFCEWDVLDDIAKKTIVPTPEMMVRIFNWYRGNAYLEENSWVWSKKRAILYESKLKNFIDLAEK